jgi:excisionase family DNA binding protein
MESLVDTTKLKTIDEATELLNKTRMTLYRWLKDEKIMSVIIGGKQFIPLCEIDRILKADTPLTRAMNKDEV